MSEHAQSTLHPLYADERYCAGEIVEGKYRLIRRIGQGGFGRVWVAHNSVLDLHLALKIIYMTDPACLGFNERLLEEARAAAQIGHPAIVRVFDFGKTAHDDPFVAMELLTGLSLAERLALDFNLPPIEAVQLLLPVADAISAVHTRGIVHRDIKPENIHLSRDDAGRLQPKLLDFGISRRLDVDHKLTGQGLVVGTPDYMSPEQARGQGGVDQRTDVWSFCVVLYELLAGHVPFDGDNYNSLLMDIIERDAPPLSAKLCGGDDELWRIIEKGLAKDKNQRWDSMRALGEALAHWLDDRGVGEDICSASLRGTWLEASGHDRLSPVRPVRAYSDSDPTLVVPARSSTPVQEPLTRDVTRQRVRPTALAVGGLAALLLGALASSHALRAQADPAQAAPRSAAMPAPALVVPARTGADEPAPPPSATESAAPSASPPAKPASKKPPPARPTASAPAPAAPVAALPPPRRRVDFGF